MPPPRVKKLTAQPIRTRNFAGKPAAPEVEQPSSSDESESEQDRSHNEQSKPKPFLNPKPAPLASSFPKSALRAKLGVKKKSASELKHLEDEFQTESEEEKSDQSGSGNDATSDSDSEEESSSEDDSSEEEAPRKLLRPVFIKKTQRAKITAQVKSPEELAAEEEQRKQDQARALVQEQIEQRAAQKNAANKDWDDDAIEDDMNAVDDTDGVDPDAEYAAWKLRELKRIRRERAAIEEAEAELAEVERRRNLTAAERDAEDRDHIEKQEEERGDRGSMQFMQKYNHRGAFFQDDLKDLNINTRDIRNAKFEDETNREVLPEYMQVRDMTKLGKKGRTRYRDMKSEDTGQWGRYGDVRRPQNQNDYSLDERFRSDAYGGRDGEGATGANAKPLGDRKRFGEESSRDSKRPRFDQSR